MTRTSFLVTLAIAAALVVSVALSPVNYPGVSSRPDDDRISLPACAQEDSENCYWDRGVNGRGMPLINLDGRTYLLACSDEVAVANLECVGDPR